MNTAPYVSVLTQPSTCAPPRWRAALASTDFRFPWPASVGRLRARAVDHLHPVGHLRAVDHLHPFGRLAFLSKET